MKKNLYLIVVALSLSFNASANSDQLFQQPVAQLQEQLLQVRTVFAITIAQHYY